MLGGGLAGLSSAYHLDPIEFEPVVLEKSNTIGGTARSVTVGGFTFDITGHLLHLHYDYTKTLIQKLLAGNLFTCVRKAAIFSNGILTEYPFQANTFGLPKKVISECVEGFKEAVEKFYDPSLRSTSLPFADWSLRAFGRGIHKHFMKPYNEKIWQVDLKEMTAEWCGMFVPQPKVEDVVAGSKRRPHTSFGYNATFLYPKKGGIQVLSQALARGLDVRLNLAAEEIQWRDKMVRASNGGSLDYDSLVSTLPLAELLKRMPGLPPEVEAAKAKLRYTSVLCINLGVKRAKISDKSWIYFPEKQFPFYRVGFPMNFTPHIVPKGCSSMYVEVGHPPDKPADHKNPKFLKSIRSGLEKAKILRKSDKILVADFIPIRCAYVIYTPERKKNVETILKFLESTGIQSIGRYGAWKYSFMEEAIMDGKKAAEKISASNPASTSLSPSV